MFETTIYCGYLYNIIKTNIAKVTETTIVKMKVNNENKIFNLTKTKIIKISKIAPIIKEKKGY